MIIRAEQMNMFESAAEEDFVRRLIAHLRENYADSLVRLPDQETTNVLRLSEETLDSLVRRSIEHARLYELTFESAISAFTALKFDVAPNFDKNSASQLCLTDEDVEPNARINELLEILTEKQWAKIREDYNPNAWFSNDEIAEESETVAEPETPGLYDFDQTVMSGGFSPQSAAKQPDFAETVMTREPLKKNDKSAESDELDFSQAMFNMSVTKE